MLENNMANQSTESRFRQGLSSVFINPDAMISITIDNILKFIKATAQIELKNILGN